MTETGAKIAIAPLKKVLFVDAALWYATFYYNALHRGMTPTRAYNRTEDMLEDVKGGFSYWS